MLVSRLELGTKWGYLKAWGAEICSLVSEISQPRWGGFLKTQGTH